MPIMALFHSHAGGAKDGHQGIECLKGPIMPRHIGRGYAWVPTPCSCNSGYGCVFTPASHLIDGISAEHRLVDKGTDSGQEFVGDSKRHDPLISLRNNQKQTRDDASPRHTIHDVMER